MMKMSLQSMPNCIYMTLDRHCITTWIVMTISMKVQWLLFKHCSSIIIIYAGDFLHAYKVLCSSPNAPDVEVKLWVMPGQSWPYDTPSSDEVAVILPGDRTAPDRRNITLHCHSSDDGSFVQIDDGHPAYYPLHYILLLPYGTNSWHQDLYHHTPPNTNHRSNSNPPRITQTQYSSFHLHTHKNEYPILQCGGCLFQHYVVDMWASADQTCMSFLWFNQGKLHADV